MNHHDHVQLIAGGVPAGSAGVWADIGAGRGAFTLALADLLGPDSTIYVVDQDGRALKDNRQAVERRFPGISVHTISADFTRPLSLPALDGLLMANALHYIRHKEPVVQALMEYLRPGGRFILVEYDTNRGNRWVPHPLTFDEWAALATHCGFRETSLLATRPSSFLGRFFSTLSVV